MMLYPSTVFNGEILWQIFLTDKIVLFRLVEYKEPWKQTIQQQHMQAMHVLPPSYF